MPDCELINFVDALAAYVKDADTVAAYPELSDLAVNEFGDPQQTQFPLLDLLPLAEEPIQPSDDGALAEHAVATVQLTLTVEATQYDQAVRDVFNRADALRRALNCNRAAIACGVAWVRREDVTQVEPKPETGVVFVNLVGTIKAQYALEAR